jgi:hypothetical protein
MHMIRNYKEVRGVLIKKYRNILGKYVFVLEENSIKTKVFIGKDFYRKAELGTKWTVGHIHRQIINIRPGFCKNPGDG